MEEKKLPFTGREKIRFNVPPFTGREYEYVRQAVENQKICGDGEFTKKASHWFEEKTGTARKPRSINSSIFGSYWRYFRK